MRLEVCVSRRLDDRTFGVDVLVLIMVYVDNSLPPSCWNYEDTNTVPTTHFYASAATESILLHTGHMPAAYEK